jgi:hypothetical protein
MFVCVAGSLFLLGCAPHKDKGPKIIQLSIEYGHVSNRTNDSVPLGFGVPPEVKQDVSTTIVTRLKDSKKKPRKYELKPGESLLVAIPRELHRYYELGLVREDEQVIVIFVPEKSEPKIWNNKDLQSPQNERLWSKEDMINAGFF